MKDISMKNSYAKYAKAFGVLSLNKQTVDLIKNNKIKSGNVIETIKSAGIMGAKNTADFILHAHNTFIEFINVEVETKETQLIVTSEVKAICKSGIESNAISSVTFGLLNAFDMLKCLCKEAKMTDIKIIESTGKGKDFKKKRINPLKAAFLIVSDAKNHGQKKDNTTIVVKDFLEKQQINVEITKILKENSEILKNNIFSLIEENFELIILAGSSSLNSKGVATTVTKEISERYLPGVSDAIRKYGKDRTPYSMFSDVICGVKGKTILLNIPGNSSGAIESLSAIFPGLLKAFSMMKKAK